MWTLRTIVRTLRTTNVRTLRTTKGSNIVMACLEKSHDFHSHVALVWPEIPMNILITLAGICAMMLRTATALPQGKWLQSRQC